MTDELSTTFVIFGASGDLTWRKLVPALYNLYKKDRLTDCAWIVGFARRPWSDEYFHERLRDGVERFSPDTFDAQTWEEFAPKLRYFQGDLGVAEDYAKLAAFLDEIDCKPSNRLYYLATSPGFYERAVKHMGAAGLADEDRGYRNVVIEKPFGIDLRSAQALNRAIHTVFDENQVYRIDHYLGKETAQNILFFRFANTIFEPVWNRNYVDCVEITVAEQVDVGDRAGYFDGAGVLRDMFQNHLMQLLALVAMEPPASFDAYAVRNERVKLFSAVRPVVVTDIVRAQYEGYRQTKGVDPDSQTETYAALKLYIDNWRWQGVPFYLRSGKALKEKVTEINIQFKEPPHVMFPVPDDYHITANFLSMCLQPDEGIHLRFEAKVPDTDAEMRSVVMDFHYEDTFGSATIPDAYENLLHDALNGDASLFTRSDGIEYAWKVIDPVVAICYAPGGPPLWSYKPGTWGPAEADEFLANDGRSWLMGCREH
jgi:glucose-6-phosphate 1-dehydrogenase